MKLLVISSYPEKDQVHGEKTVGVGNYTKATLLALMRADPGLDITVFAENLGNREDYIENNGRICFLRGKEIYYSSEIVEINPPFEEDFEQEYDIRKDLEGL